MGLNLEDNSLVIGGRLVLPNSGTRKQLITVEILRERRMVFVEELLVYLTPQVRAYIEDG